MGPGCLARIVRFLKTLFSSNRRCSSKLKIWSLRKFLVVRSAVFLLSAASPSATLAHAQSVFHFSREVHWGDTVLPPGDYVITSLDIKNTGAVLTFATPGRLPRSPNSSAQLASGNSSSANGRLFAIHNPQNQTVPHAKAQTIYLSACRVVEQEYSRTEPLRPRLTLVLGAAKDQLYYPNREIQLKNWDDYKFAQGVVMLAVNDMFPEEKKYSLSNLALLEAESTVDVSELKSSRTRLHAGPQN
jgi:hypothetical protein